MTDERWQETVGRIKDTFTVLAHEHESLDPGPGTREYVEFQNPSGKMRIELIVKPRLLDVRGQSSRRTGSQTGIERRYSATEELRSVHAYRWDLHSGDWVSLDGVPGFGT